MADSSQSTEGFFLETLELDPAYSSPKTFETCAVEQSQPDDSLHDSVGPCSSSTIIATLHHQQLGEVFDEPSEVIFLPKLQGAELSQSSNTFLPHPLELLSSSDGTQSPGDIQNDDHLHTALIATIPVFHAVEQLQRTDDFSQVSEDIPSLPSDDTPDVPLSSDGSRQSMEAAQGSPILTTTVEFQNVDSNIYQPHAWNPILTSTLLQDMDDSPFSQFSLHHPASFMSNYPDTDGPKSNNGQHLPPISMPDARGSYDTSRLNNNDKSLVRDSQLISSSSGVSMSDCNQSADTQWHRSQESLEVCSGLQPEHRTSIAHESLRHSGQQIPSPLFLSVDHDQHSTETPAQNAPAVIPSTIVVPTVASESYDEDPEIPPLQYARQNGLSRNYLQTACGASNLDVWADCQTNPMDDSHLPQFEITADVNTDERLTVSKDVALLIASVSRDDTSGWYDDTINTMIRTSRYRIPRLEPPLLRSDHETDCKSFAQRRGFEIKLEDVELPLEMVDDEKNEGLSFSPALWNKGAEVLESLKKERLEVSKSTLVYLQDILKSDWTEDDEMKIWASTKKHRRSKTLQPVTPPLSPISIPTQLYEPSMSDPVFELPILSDPESPTKQDLEDIEKQLFNDDVPTPIKQARAIYDSSSDTLVASDTFNLADIYSPAASLNRRSVSPLIERKRVKREDFKVEEPLTPNQLSEPPKFVHFSETILEWPAATRSPPTDPLESSYFEEAFGDAHAKATRMSEQESLIAADTTARVKVPDMDFSMPIPPWEVSRSRAKRSSLQDIQRSMMKGIIGQIPKWPGLNQVKVRYNPFPDDLAKVALDERCVADDSTWEALVKGPGDDEVIDTSTLTWKPAGLKILRDEDEDDEIEPGQFEKGVPQDLSFLAKKRKIEIEERDSAGEITTKDYPRAPIAEQPPGKKKPKPTDFSPPARKSRLDYMDTEGSLLMGGTFSIGNSVENFLEIRGTKKPKLGDSSYFAKAARLETAPSVVKPSPQPEILMQLPIRSSPVSKAQSPLPAPTSKIPNTPVNVIVASPFLKHRSLIKHIEKLFPDIILVERDFSAHDTTLWMPGSVTRSPIVSPLASEADIIVSPLLGIIITTLQKIKQKPLPGQKAKSAIRERLEKVSPRYEKMIVLVTEQTGDETTRGFDNSDCNAFAEFVGFALGLEDSVDIRFVGGGEATLAKWLVNVIAQHKVEEELLADETHWELFLRRAGLNSFAAQHIIGVLKAPDSIGVPSSSKVGHYGLTAFAEMGREHRIVRFGPFCGYKLMARVSDLMDAEWP